MRKNLKMVLVNTSLLLHESSEQVSNKKVQKQQTSTQQEVEKLETKSPLMKRILKTFLEGPPDTDQPPRKQKETISQVINKAISKAYLSRRPPLRYFPQSLA